MLFKKSMKKFFALLTFLSTWETNIHSAEAGMPQLDPEYWLSQIFWLTIVFITIYVLISKIFIPKIKGSIDMREDKIRKDLEEAKTFKEQAELKLKEYNSLMETAKLDVKKITSKSRQKLNEDMQIKKEQIQKKIDAEISNAGIEIKKLKNDSFDKVNLISQDIVSNLVKDIFGEDLNKSSIEASVSQTIKEYERDKQK
ncbi:MAG: hypothetical protein CBD56_01455 [Candidatus Pelagibacter sp. TMED196]|nr:MAG: hypothetical protein CBD56_01455 [Candidatus Pelagibacter sp. TMED196]